MDVVSEASGLLVAKALYAKEALAMQFAKANAEAEGAVLNAIFQMLSAAQTNLAATRDPALPSGAGTNLDIRA